MALRALNFFSLLYDHIFKFSKAISKRFELLSLFAERNTFVARFGGHQRTAGTFAWRRRDAYQTKSLPRENPSQESHLFANVMKLPGKVRARVRPSRFRFRLISSRVPGPFWTFRHFPNASSSLRGGWRTWRPSPSSDELFRRTLADARRWPQVIKHESASRSNFPKVLQFPFLKFPALRLLFRLTPSATSSVTAFYLL